MLEHACVPAAILFAGGGAYGVEELIFRLKALWLATRSQRVGSQIAFVVLLCGVDSAANAA